MSTRTFFTHVATDKVTEQGANDKYHYGVSEMQGWRISELLFLVPRDALHMAVRLPLVACTCVYDAALAASF